MQIILYYRYRTFMFFKNNILLQYDKGHARKESLLSNLKPQGLTLIWHFCWKNLSEDIVTGEPLSCMAFGRWPQGCCSKVFCPLNIMLSCWQSTGGHSGCVWCTSRLPYATLSPWAFLDAFWCPPCSSSVGTETSQGTSRHP